MFNIILKKPGNLENAGSGLYSIKGINMAYLSFWDEIRLSSKTRCAEIVAKVSPN